MSAMVFDLDGTLIDTVYGHVLAWQRAFEDEGLDIDGWQVHRRIGMSGGMFVRAAARAINRTLAADEVKRVQDKHSRYFHEFLPTRRPLPGAIALLEKLRELKVPFGIATSGRRPDIDSSLAALQIPDDVVVVERGDVERAKPEPDLFLACQQRMGVQASECYVVGDAVWDLLAARRADMLSVGLLSGGYGADELFEAGAFRVYPDAKELLESLDELGVLR